MLWKIFNLWGFGVFLKSGFNFKKLASDDVQVAFDVRAKILSHVLTGFLISFLVLSSSSSILNSQNFSISIDSSNWYTLLSTYTENQLFFCHQLSTAMVCLDMKLNFLIFWFNTKSNPWPSPIC